MESSVFLSDLLTAHEPLSIVSFISNELRVRFMGSTTTPLISFRAAANAPERKQRVKRHRQGIAQDAESDGKGYQ